VRHVSADSGSTYLSSDAPRSLSSLSNEDCHLQTPTTSCARPFQKYTTGTFPHFGYKMSHINVNQVLSSNEIEDCHRAFIKFDADQSGAIEQWELQKILESLGQKPTDQEITTMISEVDDNDSGSIDFSEFLQVMARQKLLAQESSKDQDIFDAWVAVGGGADLDGCVDGELLIKIIRNEFCLNIDIEALLKEIDTSGDGQVDFEEFKALFDK